jgi:hypothetical protein
MSSFRSKDIFHRNTVGSYHHMHLVPKGIIAFGYAIFSVFLSLQYSTAWYANIMANGYGKTVNATCDGDIQRFDNFFAIKEKFRQELSKQD